MTAEERTAEIARLSRLLADLLDAPEPGVFSWFATRNETACRLRDLLNAAIDEKASSGPEAD